MEESNNVNPDYLKGFNEGYTIAQQSPELSEQLSKLSLSGERGVGFQEGRAQFISERARERMPSWLRSDNLRSDKSTSDKSLNRDIEPEK
jgi:hypothetical protein